MTTREEIIEEIIEDLKQLSPEVQREAHRLILTVIAPTMTEAEIAARLHEAHDKPADPTEETQLANWTH